MQKFIRPLRSRNQFLYYGESRRAFTSTIRAPSADITTTDVSKTRNIGIIAHIDAGKTTTTERMLFYSGHTRRIGNVDDGSTVTDFLPAERARGVTIQSAAISFHWPPLPNDSAPRSPATATLTPHNINLIDTPGHADFTFEVLRSLRILDGAICILDGVAGVEAQTEKVWHQASQYHIPKIIYVNKLDRDGAAFGETVRQVAIRLHTYPAVCQIPWFEGGKGRFCGIGDAIGLRAVRWPEDGNGTNLEVVPFEKLNTIDENLSAEVSRARKALVEILAEHDDQMVEKYLEADEDSLDISSTDIIASLRRCVLVPDAKVAPVFAGASFKNMGVQTLLDAVVQILPSPVETPDPTVNLGTVTGTLSQLMSGNLITADTKSKSGKSMARFKKPSTALIELLESCALAFKVVHDSRRGALVYVRTYTGSIQRQSLLFNTNLQVSERAPQLLKMYASESVQVDSIPAGQIGVIPGLKYARTGDTLISYKGASSKSGPPPPLNTLQLRPIEVPPAVFFSSVESHSLSEERATKTALDFLVREDPSLQVYEDEESGQTLLSGMGEFHLEIAQDRLINDFKAKASMGEIEIAYRESILAPSPSNNFTFHQEQAQGAAKQGRASCTASVSPLTSDTDINLDQDEETTSTHHLEGNLITITLLEDPNSPPHILPPHLTPSLIHTSLLNGALAALARGVNHSYRMHNTHVSLSLSLISDLFGAESTPAAISAAARGATRTALAATAKENGTAVMEMVMRVSVSVDEGSLGSVVNDLTANRGASILSLDDDTPSNNTQAKRIDVSKIYAPPDPFASSTTASGGNGSGLSDNGRRQRTITAMVPLKEMLGYLTILRKLTGGRGGFVMRGERFERVVGVRLGRLLGK